MKHIRIISPSGAIDPKLIDGAEARLRSWGYTVSEGRFARGRYGRFAGTDAERLQDLTEALNDPTVDCILCARGGYGLQRILPCISTRVLPDSDPTATRRRPDGEPDGETNHQATLKKTLIGFSDITELHQWVLLQGGQSVHGLMCKHLCELPEDSEMIRYWRAAIEGQPLRYEVPAHALNREGTATGTLIGGNLSVLYGLQATPWGLGALLQPLQQKGQSAILFIEDIGERHYHIDRMMRNLRMSGVLAQISGLVVGQFSDCEDDSGMGCSVYDTIKEAVADYAYPVMFDFPAGHVTTNMPLLLGTTATVTVAELSLFFQ